MGLSLAPPTAPTPLLAASLIPIGFGGSFTVPPVDARSATQSFVIPKSIKPISSAIDGLDTGHRGEPDPHAITSNRSVERIPEARSTSADAATSDPQLRPLYKPIVALLVENRL